jgi:diguanylate cyclase (GGDEF)-like protein
MRNGKPSSAEVFLRHKSGHRVPVHIRAIPIKNRTGAIVGAAEYFEEPRICACDDRRASTTPGSLNPVTGLPSDLDSKSKLDQYLSAFQEHNISFSILRVHVDRLSHFTANHGLAAGEQLLRMVAQTLRNALRPEDFLGSWAESEFLIILKIHRRKALLRVAERLRAIAGSSAIQWWGDRLSITLSFGVAIIQPEDELDLLLSRADDALDQSIDGGGNRVTLGLADDPPSPKVDSCS